MRLRKKPVRLTPYPAQTPKINGVKVLGVRPGSPVLFKIPATGQKPLTYGADQLPEGLTIDCETGIISGNITTGGEYSVELTVSNELGNDFRLFIIKIGDDISLTPPMGWNSWYCHSELISEEAVRETAEAFVSKGLIDHGWTYVNIDDCWQGLRGGSDLSIQPNERFKDMKGMCDYVHSLGLKVGIYSTPWIGTYAGFTGGSAPNEQGDYSNHYLREEKRLQKHQFFGRYPRSLKKGLNRVGHWFFDRDTRQWAEWGIDYVKIDWNPNDVSTAERMSKDIGKCNRDMVVSFSNSTPFNEAKELSAHSNCWRTTGDIIDRWWSISKIGFSQFRWQHLTRPGHWNDPDMLQIGNTGIANRKNSSFKPTHLSPDEQYSQMSLWSLLSAPLLLSCDIESLDDFTLGLITNDEVIEVNQDSLGKPGMRIVNGWFRQVLTKPLEDGSIAVGLFNRGPVAINISVNWEDLGLTGKQKVRDLWRQRDLGNYDSFFSARVNRHGVSLLKISAR